MREITKDYEYEWLARKAVANHANKFINANKLIDKTDEQLKLNPLDLIFTQYSKTLQNYRATIITSRPDGMYYEFTWDRCNNVGFLEVYKKWDEITVSAEEWDS